MQRHPIAYVISKYLRTNINIEGSKLYGYRRVFVWGEEGERLFGFLKSAYLNSSLALDVGRKQLGLRFSARKIMPLWAAATVA
jgi:hypothetical protein